MDVISIAAPSKLIDNDKYKRQIEYSHNIQYNTAEHLWRTLTKSLA